MRGAVAIATMATMATMATAALLGCDDAPTTGEPQYVATKPERSWEAAPVREGNLRIATLNVRNFPGEPEGAGGGSAGVGGGASAGGGGPTREGPTSERARATTDTAMLLDLLDELAFDALAVQEIRDPAAFDATLRALEERTGSTYASAYTTNAQSGNAQQVGLVVRREALTLSEPLEHAEVDVLGTLRAGLSARLVSAKPGGVDLSVVVLHLASGESLKRATLRAEQAKATSAIAAGLAEASGDADVLVLGDLNTAREEDEYGALDAAFASALPLARHDNPSGCTSYYVKNKLGTLAPSTIDQVYSGSLGEIDKDVALASGAHCYERACAPFESDGPETGTTYWGVSDHCPVYFELRDADDD